MDIDSDSKMSMWITRSVFIHMRTSACVTVRGSEADVSKRLRASAIILKHDDDEDDVHLSAGNVGFFWPDQLCEWISLNVQFCPSCHWRAAQLSPTP